MAKKQIKTEEVVKVVEETAEKVAEAAKKASATAKKASATVKKTATKKEIKMNVALQYAGKEIFEKDIVAAVKKEWTKGKNKISDIKTMDLYLKPEENAVYYVINGTALGKITI